MPFLWKRRVSNIPISDAEFVRGSITSEEPTLSDLEYRLNPSGNDCKCCVHEDVDEVDRLFMTKAISGQEAAKRLGVSPAYYSIHIHRDVQRVVKEEVASSPIVQDAVLSTIDKVGELGTIFSSLVDRAKLLLKEPIDKKAEFRIKAIASEARAYATLLLQVEGELKDSPLIVINNMNVQFNRVVELVMEEASPSLKRKLSGMLKEMDLAAWQ